MSSDHLGLLGRLPQQLREYELERQYLQSPLTPCQLADILHTSQERIETHIIAVLNTQDGVDRSDTGLPEPYYIGTAILDRVLYRVAAATISLGVRHMETQCVRLNLHGFSTDVAAQITGIDEETIRYHAARLMESLPPRRHDTFFPKTHSLNSKSAQGIVYGHTVAQVIGFYGAKVI